MTTVIAFFVAETGDKMRLATVALAAHFQAPVQMILGTTPAVLLADPAVWLGDRLVQRVPMKRARIAAALLFAGIGALPLVALLREAT